MVKASKVLILFISSLLLITGCGVHYPSVGVLNKRIRATDWKGRRIAPQCIDRRGHKRHMTIRCERINIESR